MTSRDNTSVFTGPSIATGHLSQNQVVLEPGRRVALTLADYRRMERRMRAPHFDPRAMG